MIIVKSCVYIIFNFRPEEPIEDDPFDTTFAENILPNINTEDKNISNKVLTQKIVPSISDRIAGKCFNVYFLHVLEYLYYF